VGRVPWRGLLAECYVNPDDWGDQDEVICVFSYAGEEPHALVSVIDYNLAGMLRDGWVSSQVDKLLETLPAAIGDPCEFPPGRRLQADRPADGA